MIRLLLKFFTKKRKQRGGIVEQEEDFPTRARKAGY